MGTGNSDMRPSRGRARRFVALTVAISAVVLTGILFAVSLLIAPAGEPSSSIDANTFTGISSLAPANSADDVSTLDLRSPDSGRETATGSSLDDGQMALIRWDADTGVPAFLTGSIRAACCR